MKPNEKAQLLYYEERSDSLLEPPCEKILYPPPLCVVAAESLEFRKYGSAKALKQVNNIMCGEMGQLKIGFWSLVSVFWLKTLRGPGDLCGELLVPGSG